MTAVPMSYQMSRIAGSFEADGCRDYGPATQSRQTGAQVSTTKASQPPHTGGPVTDRITVLAFGVGWALIVLGLLFLGLALTN